MKKVALALFLLLGACVHNLDAQLVMPDPPKELMQAPQTLKPIPAPVVPK